MTKPSTPLTVADPPASLADIVDPERLAVVLDRWQELQRCCASEAWTAAFVVACGLADELIARRLGGMKAVTFLSRFTVLDSRRRQALPLAEWPTRSLVLVAHDLMLLDDDARDVAESLPDWREVLAMRDAGSLAPKAPEVVRSVALLQLTIAGLHANRWLAIERFRSQG
ncbi:MAG: hypothetical protein ACOYOB_19615 [Myxococcota bacterium]